ncbi:MAG: alpha-1,4-glucan--maltose-1-phosphate maltosyltransferase [Actinobacteria bacterium]|nr:MAG: alpha-1,4-glucan--maltose-1-phosphate maltosyltransferase [Actinomycetota bacterium]
MSTFSIPRIPVVELFPVVEGGRLPAKATEKEPFPIRATVFREGHDAYVAEATLITPEGSVHSRTRMVDIAPGLDRYEAWVAADTPGNWSFRVDTWADPYAIWCHNATIKVNAGIDVELMLEEGARLMERAAAGQAQKNPKQSPPPASARDILLEAARDLRDPLRSAQQRLSAGLSSQVRTTFSRYPLRDLWGHSEEMPLEVSRTRAVYGSWYEIFPRSAGSYQRPDGSWVSGTLRSAAEDLPRIASMGFDVVYLTPIHPIGMTNRKGKNNFLVPEPEDPGSPYAIGSPDGGHDAIHPELGTFDDFDAFVAQAHDLNLEVALDLALQCSPDHPWVKEHPEWFVQRADGTIAHAENPPKKYEDIYPLSFDTDPQGLETAIREVIQLWIDHGVTLFRVDNPHTKPLNFWQSTLAHFNERHPDVLFLSEAFTRPAMMRTLGALGFDQSYTYFAWRTEKKEIEDYLLEVSTETSHLMRPSFWPTTHDILTPQMWDSGAAIFSLRAILAATASPTWGIYSGYECVENEPRAGYEEQNNNEKYEYRPRLWETAEKTGIPQLLTLLNKVRTNHPALRQLHQIRIHRTDHPQILCFSRQISGRFTSDGQPDTVLVVLSLNPNDTVEGTVEVNFDELGIQVPSASGDPHITAVDELDSHAYEWRPRTWVRLSPWSRIAHILSLPTGNM